MAVLLYRLGRFSFRNRWLVAAIWVALLILAGVGARTLSGQTTEAFSIPGMPAVEAFERIGEAFPQAGISGAQARVVFAAPEGETLATPENQAAIAEAVAELAAIPQVVGATDPFTAMTVSPDLRVAYAQVQFAVQTGDIEEANREAMFEAVDHARASGLTAEVGGDAVAAIVEQGAQEMVGVVVAAIVLVFTFGSLVAAGLPLLNALVGVGIGISGVTIATGFVELSSTASILASMLGIAVTIDYALFIVFRYRNELSIGRAPEEAAGRAVGTAGSAVVFAGATVVVALAALGVVRIPFLTAMGLAAAFTVALAVVVALTLLPALLGFVGRRALPRRERRAGTAAPAGTAPAATAPARVTLGERWARFVTRNRVAVLLVAILGLGVVAIPVTDLRLGLPGDEVASPTTTQRRAYDLLASGFGAGFNGPLVVLADVGGTPDPQAAAGAAAMRLQGFPDVVFVTPPQVNAAGDTALFTIIPASGPSDEATVDLVHAIRDATPQIAADTGVTLSVTGQTAIVIDVSQRLADALPPYLIVVVGIALILLALVFRSVLVPIKATLGFLLTIGATFGAVVAVFQWGWLGWLFGVDTTAPIMSLLPILMIGIVFGLAMDYQVFLVSRMREEFVHGAAPTPAVVTGFAHGARVVTAAAIIMISVFAGFVLGGELMIKEIGFAMAFGVFVDAFIVRMTIVPAVMSLLGRSAWWIPRWLDRVLPNVDVEGERLRRLAPGTAPAPSPAE